MMLFWVVFVVCFLAFWMFGGREVIGECIAGLFPSDPLRVGDKMDVFVDGQLNRTATVTSITQDSVIIYDRLPLPIDYRGSFYAVGVDANDGTKLVYVKTRKNYKLVRIAELIKRFFALVDDEENLMPDDMVKDKTDSEKGAEEVEDEL